MPISSTAVQSPAARGVGKLITNPLGAVRSTGVRTSPATTRVLSIATGTCTSGVTYSIRGRKSGSDWVTVGYLTGATTDTLLRAGLIASWNGNPQTAGMATASAAGSGVAVRFADVTAGANDLEIEIVENPASALGAVTVVTAGAAAAETPFGRYVRLGAESTSGYGISRAVTLPAAGLAGPVITIALVHAASDTAQFLIEMNTGPAGIGVAPFSGSGIASGADLAAFRANFVTALESAGIDDYATITGTASTIVLSFPVGWSIVSASASATATSEANLTITDSGSEAPEYALVYDDGTVAADTIGEVPTGYPADAVVPLLLSGGQCSVASPGTVTTGGRVWIDTVTGIPGIAPTPTSVAHPTHRWAMNDAYSSSPTLAIIGA
jgi:hypothetical protein